MRIFPRPVIVLVALALVLPAVAAAAKRKPSRTPCPGGRFVLAAPAVLGGGPAVHAVVVGASGVSVASCPSTPATLKAGRKGTTLRATWTSCPGIPGRVTLRARIVSDCQELRGVLRLAKGKPRRLAVAGARSRCGDGRVDAAGGEECDGTGCAAGDTCSPTACTCAGPATITYDVTYTPETVVVDAGVVRDQLIREEGGRWVFSAGADAVRALQPGQVVIFAERALRRVTGVESAGGEIVVVTEPAALNDAISDGTMEWRVPLRFDRAAAARAVTLQQRGALLAPSDGALDVRAEGDGVSFSGTIAGVDVSLTLTPGDERLDIDGTMSAGSGTAGVKATAKGWVRGIGAFGRLVYQQRRLRELDLQATGIEGELTLGVVGLRLSNDGFRIPIPLAFPFHILVGPIPVVFNLRANATIIPVLAGNSSSDLQFKVTFSADQGVRLEGEEFRPFGQLQNEGFSLERATTAGAIPVGIGFGLEFPRLEIGILGNVIVPYASVITAVEGYYTPVLTAPCQHGGSTIRGALGYQFSFLGVQRTGERELFKKERFTRRDSRGVGEGKCP